MTRAGPHEESLSLRDAAILLGVSESILRKWSDEGWIRASRTIGGHRRFSVAEVEMFLDRSMQPAGEPA